ncbi:MAG: SPOR domain-containing protein [Sphingobium sp.]
MTQHFLKPALASALSPLLAIALLAGGAVSALADVKAGVDAWAQGDYAKAVGEWTPLAQQGDADAQFNLGQAYKLGRGVPVNIDLAIDYYRKAAAQGHARAEDNYGLMLFQQNRRIEAMPYIERSAQRGEPRAQYLMGVALFNGDLTAKDWPRAYAMMTRAASTDLPQATTSLARMNQFIPEDQRQQGTALAARMEKEEQAAKLAATSATVAPAQPLRQPPTPIRQAELPPATIAPTATGAAPVSVAPTLSVTAAEATPPEGPSAPAAPDAPTAVAVAEASPAPAPAKAQPAPAPASQASASQASASQAKATPKPAAASTPAPKAAPAGKWRVQLGAFSEKARAETQWKTLSAKIGDLSGLTHYVEQSGAVTRLQAGPFATQGEASRLCAKVKAKGSDCLVKSL